MNATTHAVFGVAALAGASLLVGEAPPPHAYPAAVVAAWVPDLDNPRSRLGNGLSRTKNPLLNTVTRPLSWAMRAVSFTLFRTVGHRTLTHSLLGLALFALIVSPLSPFVPGLFFALVAGFASHLVADALNTPGVPLLWPLDWRLRLLPGGGIKSGGVAEFVAVVLAFAVAVYAILALYPGLGRALGLPAGFPNGLL
jgi:inner membrane protein